MDGMRCKILHYGVIGAFLFVLAAFPVCAYDLILKDTPVSVYFSPNGGGQQAIVDAIGQARESVYVQAYSFTSAPIAKALVNTARRSVKVEVILDRSQRKETYTGATFLKNEGIPVYIDATHSIAHNKVIIIDGQFVITGSFNFTKAAEEKNAENCIIIHNKELASIYMKNLLVHLNHSGKY